MRVKVLGCSGAIAKGCRTTSFLLDHDVLIDAGTGVGDLSLEEMQQIDDVYLTHSHLDHILSLPLMLDSVGALRSQPLRVHALAATLDALEKHIFNNIIWPDFRTIPHPDTPYITFHEIEVGKTYVSGGKLIEVLPAVHAVPAVGYAAASQPGLHKTPVYWVFSGDTERNPAFWQRVNELSVGMLVIETTFSNDERALAQRSAHLCAEVLLQELQLIETKKRYPIYITHTKPAEAHAIMQEIEQLNHVDPNVTIQSKQATYLLIDPNLQTSPAEPRLHQLACLATGQEFEV